MHKPVEPQVLKMQHKRRNREQALLAELPRTDALLPPGNRRANNIEQERARNARDSNSFFLVFVIQYVINWIEINFNVVALRFHSLRLGQEKIITSRFCSLMFLFFTCISCINCKVLNQHVETISNKSWFNSVRPFKLCKHKVPQLDQIFSFKAVFNSNQSFSGQRLLEMIGHEVKRFEIRWILGNFHASLALESHE